LERTERREKRGGRRGGEKKKKVRKNCQQLHLLENPSMPPRRDEGKEKKKGKEKRVDQVRLIENIRDPRMVSAQATKGSKKGREKEKRGDPFDRRHC